jgi:hypothetical protein
MNGRKLRFSVAFAGFWAAFPALVLSAGQRPDTTGKVQYELKLAKGQSYVAKMVADSNVVQESEGQEARSQVSLGLGYRLDINDIDSDGDAVVLCTVTWVKFKQKSLGMETGYDSADADHPIPVDALGTGPAGLLGEKFTAHLTRQGQVQEIQGLAAIRQNIEKKIPEGPARDQVMEGLTEQQLAGSIREYFLRPLAIYPIAPVGVGDTWNRQDTSETAPYNYATRWTLKSRNGGIAVIDANTVITPKAPSEQDGATISGQSHGQIEMDEATGRILRSKRVQTTSGRMMVGSSTFGVKTDSVTMFEMTERKIDAAF